MHYFVVLTKECNLFCTYCGGGSDTPPREIQYSIEGLKSFLAGDPDPVVEFYGGEPLLRLRKMKEIMDEVPARFVVQTNGTYLDAMSQDVLSRLHSILVSVDGTKEVTDAERGAGVYDRVVRNVERIRERGFDGDVVARMTVVQGSDIYANVMHLLDTGLFDHVHWQLSFSTFWEAGEMTEPHLEEWLQGYNSGVRRLVNWWVSRMRETGRVPGLVPAVGVMRSLLSGENSGLRCGSGADFFTVMPDGRISACPVALDFGFSVMGSISENTPESLRNGVPLGPPCTTCDVYNVCGGRCLLVNRAQNLLREGGYTHICGTVRNLIEALQASLPEVRGLLDDGKIQASDFEYPELNNGCEVIP